MSRIVLPYETALYKCRKLYDINAHVIRMSSGIMISNSLEAPDYMLDRQIYNLY